MMCHLQNLHAQHQRLLTHMKIEPCKGVQDAVHQKLKSTTRMFERSKKLFSAHMDVSTMPSLSDTIASDQRIEDASMEEDIF